MPREQYTDAHVERLLEQLAEGKSLITICAQDDMPSRSTVYNWMLEDSELGWRVLEAREVGFHLRAEMAVAAAKNAKDPLPGRLAFDSEKWYLGKLSKAFAEKPVSIGPVVNVDVGEAFDAVAKALEKAAAAIAGSGTSTKPVVIEGETRPGNASGRLADMAGDGGKGLGKDPDGS
ncbi:hypothetical protein GCM10011371_08430 [Novosphingobium marinum]|uniref:Terminase small subunit n=1 Tax=Novosphingobium marinum TaxID=1514948 RepID=A0A7Y9XWV4_9SPHN|nr:hypothetical protein [Novosphingobium marinum]NYH94531.1 hypothetical protein [Novosphingobium marinum]GGC23046.1 hypothetical protein GCM10011371_08430 [Novosphingobium marinum]